MKNFFSKRIIYYGIALLSFTIMFLVACDDSEPLIEDDFELNTRIVSESTTFRCHSGWPGNRACNKTIYSSTKIVNSSIRVQVIGHNGARRYGAYPNNSTQIAFWAVMNEGDTFNPGKHNTTFRVTWNRELPIPCNDGHAEGYEECDKWDLKYNTCSSLGYDGGSLRCNNYCRFDVSNCMLDPFEAESYVNKEHVKIEKKHNVGYVRMDKPEGWFELGIDVPRSGMYYFSFRYSLKDKNSKCTSISVNNGVGQNLCFSSTGSWENWTNSNKYNVRLYLKKGSNNLRVKVTGKQKGGLNIDNVLISTK